VLYPERINQKLGSLHHFRVGADADAVGAEANFSCGSFVRFHLSIDGRSASVTDAAFTSNGCGFMLAAAELLAERISGNRLNDLHGLTDNDLGQTVAAALSEVPNGRSDCVKACFAALRRAFADFRARQIEEFRGERALICTCFGVTEDTIESNIQDLALETVDDVSGACNAGSGCGSCRMLIQEMLDNRPG
jgi:NifU-like protein